jgi:hypothetical protein
VAPGWGVGALTRANDILKVGAGSDSLKDGKGKDKINADDGQADKVNCGKVSKDSAVVDELDTTKRCEKVTVAGPFVAGGWRRTAPTQKRGDSSWEPFTRQRS